MTRSDHQQVMRRDLRPGQATATARTLEDSRGVVLDVNFGQPFPGASDLPRRLGQQ